MIASLNMELFHHFCHEIIEYALLFIVEHIYSVNVNNVLLVSGSPRNKFDLGNIEKI